MHQPTKGNQAHVRAMGTMSHRKCNRFKREAAGGDRRLPGSPGDKWDKAGVAVTHDAACIRHAGRVRTPVDKTLGAKAVLRAPVNDEAAN